MRLLSLKNILFAFLIFTLLVKILILLSRSLFTLRPLPEFLFRLSFYDDLRRMKHF